MGQDAMILFGHSFSKSEILSLPNRIEHWDDVNATYSKWFSRWDDKEFVGQGSLQSRASEGNNSESVVCELNENDIELIWLRCEGAICLLDKKLKYSLDIKTPYGRFVIYRKSILFTIADAMYPDFRHEVLGEYIFSLIRTIAKNLNQKYYIVGADCCSVDCLLVKASEGNTLDEIREFAISTYGDPPKEVNAAIENLFFIDEYDIDYGKIDMNKEVWSRQKHEWKLETSKENNI